jgi:hypothetical protein
MTDEGHESFVGSFILRRMRRRSKEQNRVTKPRQRASISRCLGGTTIARCLPMIQHNRIRDGRQIVWENKVSTMIEGCGTYVYYVAPLPRARQEGSAMWLLLIVLLNVVPGFAPITPLKTYATAEQCLSERNRIGFEMAAAYPHERNFVIVCRLGPKHSF